VKAALLVRPGRIVVGEVPDPQPGPGEVGIAVGGVGLCGSDLSVFRGTWAAPAYPWIQGHEAFGTVDAVGPGVDPARVGETVVVEPNVPCFACPSCAVGRTSTCAHRRSVGMNRPGALAERLVVPSANAWPAPGVAPVDLACVEPLTVVEAALRRLGDPSPARALVIGAGSQGLLMATSLVDRGADVHVHDVSSDRVAFATTLGARPLVDADPLEADLVVDTVGTPPTAAAALRHAGIGATILVLGLASTPFELTAQVLVRRQLVLRGSLTYDHPADFAATVARVVRGEVHPGRVITDAYPLEEAGRAFESSGSGAGKAWIRVGSA
jgi:alcohol dehydrogenase/L-iditol 2-dehydrogenase